MVNKYYQKDKQMLRKEAHKRYQNLSEEEKEKQKWKKARDRYKNISEEKIKEKVRHYHRNRNKNLSEEEKQKKVEYTRNCYLAHKKKILGFYKIV